MEEKTRLDYFNEYLPEMKTDDIFLLLVRMWNFTAPEMFKIKGYEHPENPEWEDMSTAEFSELFMAARSELLNRTDKTLQITTVLLVMNNMSNIAQEIANAIDPMIQTNENEIIIH